MASTKNTNNTANTAAASSSNDAGGFKTVAFGFDKNDVTMYIASLRKKMKAMEEEFEQKLAQALENPTGSSDALKHEREVIRAEMEKQWNDKILERTSIIKNQQAQINELEKQLSQKNEAVNSLKVQLAAATSSGDGGGSSTANAKAAEAYMRFTAELRSISDSAQKTLASIEQVWGGEFGVSSAGKSTAPASAPVSAPEPAKAAAAPVNKPAAAPVSKPAAAPVSKPAASNYNDDFGSLLADEEDDPLAGIVSDLNDSGNGVKVPLKNESAPAPKPAPAPAPKPAPAPAPKPAPKPEPVMAEISDDDFSSLLADGDDDAAEMSSFNPAAAAPKGDDLDADLLSDMVIAPGEKPNGDLGRMLKEKEENEFDAFKDLFVSEAEPEEDAGIDSDLTIAPITEADIKPGISTEFDLKSEEKSSVKGLEDFISNIDDSEDTTMPASEPDLGPAPEPIDKNKEEDLFDFSFLASSDDDEDDMSSSISDF